MTTISNTFRTGEPSLADLLGGIHSGDVQLPDFQRGWVWDDDHIRRGDDRLGLTRRAE